MKRFPKYLQLFLVLFCAGFCTAQTKTSLDAAEFEKAISGSDSVQLLDVRTPQEFNGGHLANALLADWKQEQEFLRRVSFMDKEKAVFVYCLGGGRSAEAAEKMREMGYKYVYELKGGINAWKAGNKPVEGRSSEKQMSLSAFNTAVNVPGNVLVDFGATWCPPCRKMEPVLQSLGVNYAGKFSLLKIDGGKDEEVLKQYNVTQLPVFILFKDGKQVWRKEGIVSEKEIADQL